MIYISPENKYPLHYGDIMLANKGWQLGDELPTGWVKVEMTEPPEVTANQTAEEEFPVEINGAITRSWVVRDLTQAELDRRDAPANAKAKLIELGLTEAEVSALVRGLVR